MKSILSLLMFLVPLPTVAQSVDIISLADAEQQNTLLSNALATAFMAQAGLSCACEANLVIAGLPQDQVANVSAWLGGGQLPPNLRERVGPAAKYCVSNAPLPGLGR